jgi:hypothetical protein
MCEFVGQGWRLRECRGELHWGVQEGTATMCQCEDRPCCGHLAEERADDAYQAERAYYGSDYDGDYLEYDESEECCDSCGGTLEDPEDSEACSCGSESWGREDSALESSLFGDC